jgi:REP element-mobilizing transposase RayT
MHAIASRPRILASSVTLSALVQHLKGGSAYELHRKELIHRRMFWQDGYWAESLGPQDLNPILRYVRGQRDHHDPSHPAERWQARVSPP